MILRPSIKELKVIAFYLSKILLGYSYLFGVPLILAVALREWSPALDFAIGGLSTFIAAQLLAFLSQEGDLHRSSALVMVPFLWLLAMFFGAIPLYLSGHFGSYLDACFDAMSGLATTGLTVIQNLDHLPYSTNFWRHFTMFIGGQGIVVTGLLLLAHGSGAVYEMYAGEGREEKIFPNVLRTARFIWIASLVYLVVGTMSLWLATLKAGLPPLRGLFHSLCLFMAAFDTGGFTPQSQSILYYHNSFLEIVTVFLMFAGTINFGLHYVLWFGDRREIIKNIETVSLFLTIALTWTITSFGLTRFNAYSTLSATFRKGFYQLISAHSGTGYTTIYSAQFNNQWSDFAVAGIIIAMALGGGACSTAGGIKALRVALSFKSFIYEIKKTILPPSSIIVERYHHFKDRVLEDGTVRTVFIITLLYLAFYFIGGLIGSAYGYPFSQALFESTSATANVGLSVGITSPSMPWGLKVFYIIQMWWGRLEFLSALALIGVVIALWRGK